MTTVKKALIRAEFSLMLSGETGQLIFGYVSMIDLDFINFRVVVWAHPDVSEYQQGDVPR